MVKQKIANMSVRTMTQPHDKDLNVYNQRAAAFDYEKFTIIETRSQSPIGMIMDNGGNRYFTLNWGKINDKSMRVGFLALNGASEVIKGRVFKGIKSRVAIVGFIDTEQYLLSSENADLMWVACDDVFDNKNVNRNNAFSLWDSSNPDDVGTLKYGDKINIQAIKHRSGDTDSRNAFVHKMSECTTETLFGFGNLMDISLKNMCMTSSCHEDCTLYEFQIFDSDGKERDTEFFRKLAETQIQNESNGTIGYFVGGMLIFVLICIVILVIVFTYNKMVPIEQNVIIRITETPPSDIIRGFGESVNSWFSTDPILI